jgi:putative transcriptional regulator
VVEALEVCRHVNNRIRVLRAGKKWSQADLAERVGVSRNSINSIENGKVDPSLPLAFRIADAFGLAIEGVFLREEGSLHSQEQVR